MKKIYGAILAVLLVSVSGCFAQIEAKKLFIEGLREPVTVRKDERGIPYIEAKNEADLYFAQGYVTAADRLWQMDLLRRTAGGELAEIFGKLVLEEDKRWRKFGFAKVAEENLKLIAPDLRTALEHYSRGVNAYIKTLNKETLPIEFKILQYSPREWQPSDTILIGKILADGLSTTWRFDLMRASIQSLPKDKIKDLTNKVTPYDVVLFGKDIDQVNKTLKAGMVNFLPSDTLAQKVENEEEIRKSSLERVGFYAEELAASNNWVISGQKTTDGKALLANDPHLPPTAPGIWYLTHLSAPNLRVSGVTFPGVPGIVLGHNENIAWGATNVGPDVQDLYIETFNEDGEYKSPQGWLKPVIRTEQIKVRKNVLSAETETVSFEVLETRNGPIFTESDGKKFALKWTAIEPVNHEFEAFFFLNRAKNWEDFQSALKRYGGATQNFVYADVRGNIGWYAAGKIPIRRTGDGEFPYDGSTNDGDWTGYIPFEELPHLYNPPNGFIVTANQRIVGTDYKYPQMSRDAASPWRARRIFDLINAKSKLSMKDVSDIQYDIFNLPLSNLAREIVKRKTVSEETLTLLNEWDGKMSADAAAPIIVNEIRNCLANKIADDNKPVPSWIIREKVLDWAVRENSVKWLPKGFSDYAALIKACETGSLESLSKPAKFGPDRAKWLWGNSFSANFMHPLTLAPLIGGQFTAKFTNVDGSGQTPNVGGYVSMRHISKPADWDETRHVIPLGQSGDPQSPHWKDQFESWRTGKPAIFPFSKESVEKATREVVILQPK